jgi:hypothetical protein
MSRYAGLGDLTDAVDTEDGGMFGSGFEAADGIFDRQRGQRFQFAARFSDHPLSESRAGRDRGRAASGLKTSFHDTIVFKSRPQPQHVAARGISHVDLNGRRREFACVPGIAKMIEQPVAVHFVLQLSL